ncbi:hypothetical protein BJ973_007025 [Actinoplanes tereljensis]|uniref:Uncharacterized protein n=1 Tax=Paractinoplanes tereljensis TaxID=571912 RepID=A0A919NWN5_9ACTN|nr:hypothetical protein [Actinoplanes tereljensis]GIF24762.1 hypothetical protein Ate02nite_74920 [Actinoplanes tereljensis]
MSDAEDISGDARKEVLDLYKSSVEEYRFQVQLNWSRSQYLLAFNVAVVAAGAGLIKVESSTGSILTSGVFVVGAVAAVLSAAVTKVQHSYYRAARGRMQRFEARLGIERELRVDTTPTMGSRLKRIGRITTMLYLVFAVTAVLDVMGFIVAVDSANSAPAVIPGPSGSAPASVTPSAGAPSPISTPTSEATFWRSPSSR